MMSKMVILRSAKSDKFQWDVAPADHEIYSDETIKPLYRQAVADMLEGLTNKSLMKKPFFTIATNVLCPHIDTGAGDRDIGDANRDVYLPIEISITKWSIRDAKINRTDRKFETKHWIINPGPHNYHMGKYVRLHKPKHKIEFDEYDAESPYINNDLQAIAREINSFLTVDRMVFSQTLKHVRQDLGSLKWLNREMEYKLKPITVLNLVDLYVLLMRKFKPDLEIMGQGPALHRLELTRSSRRMCRLHRDLFKTGEETDNCAKALTISKSHRLLDDLKLIAELYCETN